VDIFNFLSENGVTKILVEGKSNIKKRFDSIIGAIVLIDREICVNAKEFRKVKIIIYPKSYLYTCLPHEIVYHGLLQTMLFPASSQVLSRLMYVHTICTYT